MTPAVRAVTPDDGPALAAFAAQVTRGERRFLKEDLATLTTADHDGEESRPRPLVAVDAEHEVLGVAGAFPGAGWSSHVAELRVFVGARHRGRGVGRALARAALEQALALGCSHAYVEVLAEQEALVTMFQDFGFEPVALLPDFCRDAAGELRDLMVLSLRVDDQGLLHALGIGEVAT